MAYQPVAGHTCSGGEGVPAGEGREGKEVKGYSVVYSDFYYMDACREGLVL